VENERSTTDVDVIKIINHSAYDTTSHVNDIAILKLAKKVTFSASVRPICIPEEDQAYENRQATVVGWGATDYGILLPFLSMYSKFTN
jgi:secreted trypsin-like serine protease